MKKKNTKIDNNAIDTVEMFTALDDLEKENGINKEELMKSIEQALVLAYNKNYGTEEGNVDVILRLGLYLFLDRFRLGDGLLGLRRRFRLRFLLLGFLAHRSLLP